jgi:hypothetical protein
MTWIEGLEREESQDPIGIWNIIMGRVTNNTKWFSHFCYELMTFFLREHKE